MGDAEQVAQNGQSTHVEISRYMFLDRRISFRIYPNKEQEKRLNFMHIMHRKFWNTALERRKSIYKEDKSLASWVGMCKWMAIWRKGSGQEDYLQINQNSMQQTIRKLDTAYKRAFQNIKKGVKPAGFPKFKHKGNFSGWSYGGNGWNTKWHTTEHGKKVLSLGILKEFTSVGLDPWMRLRGPTYPWLPNAPLSSPVISLRAGKWYVSFVVKVTKDQVAKPHGNEEVGIDWGTSSFLTDHLGNKVENPRFFRQYKERKILLHRRLSRCKKGSGNWRRVRSLLRRLEGRFRGRRKDFHHRVANSLIARASVIATEGLDVKSMTRRFNSPYYSKKLFGKRFRTNLNRSILDTGPTQFFSIVNYKAKVSGVYYEEISTRDHTPSRVCPLCGRYEKKELNERVHNCPDCGLVIDRDQASALVCRQVVTGAPFPPELLPC